MERTVQFEGIASTGSQTVNLTFTQGQSVGAPTSDSPQGYNLIGNPYPSMIDWDLVNIPADVEAAYVTAAKEAGFLQ